MVAELVQSLPREVVTCFWLFSNCKNDIISYELHRALGVTQKSAWFMLHRVRGIMVVTGDAKLGNSDSVELDETFIGGKLKNMHKSKHKPIGYQGGNVRACLIEYRSKGTMQPPIHAHVEAGSHVITDEHTTYRRQTTGKLT